MGKLAKGEEVVKIAYSKFGHSWVDFVKALSYKWD